MSETAKKRLGFISFIQFVGVLCVIFGHSMNDIAVPDGLREVKYWVYTFHMPLFFLVSGYLFAYTGGFEHKGGYWGTLKSKVSRLLIPYVIWNLGFLFPKMLMAPYISESVELTPEFFVTMALYPRYSILGHTWFLFALFEMFVIAILLERWRKNRILWIPVTCVLAIVFCFQEKELFLAVNDLMKDVVFFWIGMLLGTVNIDKLKEVANNSNLMLWVLGIIIGTTVVWAFNHTIYYSSIPFNSLVLGISVIVLIGILQIKYNMGGSIITFVSRNSFAIYIMHWPILMVLRLVFYQKMHLAPIPTMLIMFAGGFAITTGLAWLFRQFKTPFMKGFNKVVLGM